MNEYDHIGYEGLVDVIFSVANNGAGTAYTSTAFDLTLVFSEVRVAQCLVFYVVYCRSLFVFLSFFLRSLYCVTFDFQSLITLFVSSNMS